MYLAYLDAGSGSMIAAAVVAGFSGAMVAVKMWSRRVIDKLRGRKAPAETEAPVPAEQDQ